MMHHMLMYIRVYWKLCQLWPDLGRLKTSSGWTTEHSVLCPVFSSLIEPGAYCTLVLVFRFPKDIGDPEFEEKTQHILDSLVDAYVVAIKADTKMYELFFWQPDDCFYFSPILNKLVEFQKRNQTELKRRLQLISTDTWDISDDLHGYADIADLLIVSLDL